MTKDGIIVGDSDDESAESNPAPLNSASTVLARPGQAVLPNFAELVKDERSTSVRGWTLASGIGVVLLGVALFAVHQLSGGNLIVTGLVGMVMLLAGAALVRHLLRRCNYSLPCFLTGAKDAINVQPVQMLRARRAMQFNLKTQR